MRTLWLRFLEGGSKHPLRTLDGCVDLLGGGKPDFEFLGGGAAHPAHPGAHVWTLGSTRRWFRYCIMLEIIQPF